MKKVLTVLSFLVVALAAIVIFQPEARAKVTGYLYGHGLYIESVPGTTTASITSAGALSVTSITGPTSVTATKVIASGEGSVGLYSRTKAQLVAITPAAAGQAYFCSDCTAVTICTSSGTGRGAFVKVTDKTAACD
jgi:hypothetical protein